MLLVKINAFRNYKDQKTDQTIPAIQESKINK